MSAVYEKFMAEACNYELAQELQKVCRRLRKAHPGVWTSETVKSLARFADQLGELTEHRIDPTIVASWQPLLPLVVPEKRQNTDEGDGLGLCSVCHDVYVTAGSRLCSSCAAQEYIDSQ